MIIPTWIRKITWGLFVVAVLALAVFVAFALSALLGGCAQGADLPSLPVPHVSEDNVGEITSLRATSLGQTGYLRGLREVKHVSRAPVADRDFLLTLGILGAAKTADLLATARANPQTCRETNPIFGGPHPGAGRIAAVGASYFVGEAVIAYGLKRVFRGHRWLGQLWRLEPAYQGQEHLRLTARAITIGCAG